VRLLSFILVGALVVPTACGADLREVSVLEEIGLLSAPGEGWDWMAEELTTMREADHAAAFCMRQQGYEYIEWSPQELVFAPIVNADLSPLGTAAYAEEVGYGILYNLPNSIRTHPSAKQNPNDVYTDGLKREEWFAYNQTLLGANGGDGIRRPSVNQELYEEGGCLGRELRKTGEFERSNLRGTLFPAFEDLKERANADPRLLAYDDQWSTCMAESGYQYESSRQAQADFRDQFSVLWAGTEYPVDGLTRDDLQALTSVERAALYSQGPTIDESQWAAALETEIEVATADLRCQGKSRRNDLERNVLKSLEARFIAQNRDIVEQLRGSSE